MINNFNLKRESIPKFNYLESYINDNLFFRYNDLTREDYENLSSISDEELKNIHIKRITDGLYYCTPINSIFRYKDGFSKFYYSMDTSYNLLHHNSSLQLGNVVTSIDFGKSQQIICNVVLIEKDMYYVPSDEEELLYLAKKCYLYFSLLPEKYQTEELFESYFKNKDNIRKSAILDFFATNSKFLNLNIVLKIFDFYFKEPPEFNKSMTAMSLTLKLLTSHVDVYTKLKILNMIFYNENHVFKKDMYFNLIIEYIIKGGFENFIDIEEILSNNPDFLQKFLNFKKNKEISKIISSSNFDLEKINNKLENNTLIINFDNVFNFISNLDSMEYNKNIEIFINLIIDNYNVYLNTNPDIDIHVHRRINEHINIFCDDNFNLILNKYENFKNLFIRLVMSNKELLTTINTQFGTTMFCYDIFKMAFKLTQD